MSSMNKTDELLKRGVENIYPNEPVLKNLILKKKIKLYQGFDPSTDSLHIGHLSGLIKLRQFQNEGHKVIFLIGDFTGMIGDPTDKTAVRKKLTRAQTRQNAKNFEAQAKKIIRFNGKNPAEIIYNSSWQDKITFKDLIELASNFTVGQMIERDFFQERLKQKKPIFLHEFLYPVAQAIDSLELEVDLELGGNDQMFNMMCGRSLVKAVKGKEKHVMTLKLLTDSKGEKVGKTTGNALSLSVAPDKLFGGIMSFSDSSIISGFELLTEVPMKEIKELEKKLDKNPLDLKKQLAFEITKLVHSEKEAEKAKREFENVFQKGEKPTALKIYRIGKGENIINMLVATDLASSTSEAKRLVKQGAVDLNGKKITDCDLLLDLKGKNIIRCGKHNFIKIICD